MSYVPGHLELLDRSGTYDGWPSYVDERAKEEIVRRVKLGLEKYGELNLDLAYHCIFEDWVTKEPKPDCLKDVCLWDAIYAVCYRALLAADARQVWRAKKPGEW